MVWLDDHSEKTIWTGIKTCIDAYAHLVNERGDPKFADIYPILLQLGPRLVQSWKENSGSTENKS